MNTFSDTLESMITFNNIDEKIAKLKEWELLSPKAKEFKKIYYKNKSYTYECDIIGYFSKRTNSGCLSDYYETAVIKVENNIIKIAPAYLLEMQKKDYSYDFVAIDFETANSNMSSACSIGLVGIKNNEIVDTFYSLIKPHPFYFDRKNTEIHGITIDDINDAPTFPEVWEQIKKYFNKNIIIAHNAAFDMSVLKNCFIEHKMDMPSFDYLCSIPLSTFACHGEKIGASLKDRATHFDIEIENHHTADSDAITCAELVITCIKNENCKVLKDYISICNNISIKHFGELNPQKEFNKSSNSHHKFNKISISEIVATTDSFNVQHPLYGNNIVFTGDLKSLERKVAMQKVVNLGAVVKSGVSSKTNFLVVGVQDNAIVGDDGMSSKEEKAYELIKKGIDIKILNEEEFLKLLN